MCGRGGKGHFIIVEREEAPETIDVMVFGCKRETVLTYLNRCESGSADVPGRLERGRLVTVPYGRQQRTGIVVGQGSYSGDGLRPVVCAHSLSIDEKTIDKLGAIGNQVLLSVNKMLERVAPRVIDLKEPAAQQGMPESLLVTDYHIERDTLFYPENHSLRHQTASELALSLQERGQVLILCPTKADVSKIASLLPWCSKLESPDRDGAFINFLCGRTSIAVGTRSSALFFGENLKSIVVLDPASPSYIEQHRPHLNAAEIAKSRALSQGVLYVAVGRCATAKTLQGLVLKTGKGHKTPELEYVAKERGVIPPSLQARLAKEAKHGRRVCVVADDGLRDICVQCSSVVREAECLRCGSREKRTAGHLSKDIQKSVSPGVSVKTRDELLTEDQTYDIVVVRDAHLSFAKASFNPAQDMLYRLSDVAARVSSGGSIIMLSPEKYRQSMESARTWGALCRSVAREHRTTNGDKTVVTLEITSETKPKVDTQRVKWRGPIEFAGKKGRAWRYVTVPLTKDLRDVEEHLLALAKRYDATWFVS